MQSSIYSSEDYIIYYPEDIESFLPENLHAEYTEDNSGEVFIYSRDGPSECRCRLIRSFRFDLDLVKNCKRD